LHRKNSWNQGLGYGWTIVSVTQAPILGVRLRFQGELQHSCSQACALFAMEQQTSAFRVAIVLSCYKIYCGAEPGASPAFYYLSTKTDIRLAEHGKRERS
jgi:hypothetical protein